jgi:hypothetical protein
MIKELSLRYAGPVVPVTGILGERYETEGTTLRDLLNELDRKYGGFDEIFVNRKTGKLNLNVMIYYGGPGNVPVAVIDLDQPIEDHAKITFW